MVAAGARPARRRSERSPHRARRRRLRPARLLRVRHRDPDHRRHRGGRCAARELPHDRALLADPGVPADRPQSSPQWHGSRRRPGDGLSRLLGNDPARERIPPRDPARERLCELRSREVAPHARRRGEHGRVAQRAGRSAAASTAGTAFTAARHTSSIPRCTTTTMPCSRRVPTTTAITSAPISPTVPSSSSPTSVPSTTSSRSSVTSRPARVIRRTTRRPIGSRATTDSSTGLGRVRATRRSPVNSRVASSRRALR